MVNLLRRLFIKDYENVKNQNVREAHGKMASIVGIISNLILFIIKIIAGVLSGAISIISDSINNLSDMASSIVSLVGFKLSNMPADEEHPYGHQRLEYIAGFVVAILIMFVGGILGYTSIMKIINYQPEEIDYVVYYISMGILAISILLKVWQSLFNKRVGKIINSTALEATAADSRNDVIATSVVLIGMIVTLILDINKITCPFSLDGVLGVCVSLFIIISGIGLIKETANPLIGNQVPKEYAKEIVDFVLSDENILGVHDVVCHMYGPTKCFMTLHAEVDSTCNILDAHEAIDNIEQAVAKKYGIMLTIHMDPIEVGNEYVNNLKNITKECINEIDENLSFHDFRVVKKQGKDTLLFDIVIPFKYKHTKEELNMLIEEKLLDKGIEANLLIHYDHEF